MRGKQKKKAFVALLTGVSLMAMSGEILAATAQWDDAIGGNDHWYEFVANNKISVPQQNLWVVFGSGKSPRV